MQREKIHNGVHDMLSSTSGQREAGTDLHAIGERHVATLFKALTCINRTPLLQQAHQTFICHMRQLFVQLETEVCVPSLLVGQFCIQIWMQALIRTPSDYER